MGEEMMFIKPVAGRRCKDPVTCKLIPEAGVNVPRTSYWLRRLKDGDCTEEKKKKTAPKKTEPEKTAPKKTAPTVQRRSRGSK